jgi:GNAT superfamily N-acetyltransferase
MAKRTTWLAGFNVGAATEQGPQVEAPEGGTLAVDTPGLIFATRHGYRLEQIERRAVLSLPTNPVRLARLADESRRAASGYRLHVWVDDIPVEWRTEYAAMCEAFLAEAPIAGMDFEPETWNEARIKRDLALSARQGRTRLFAAVEQVAAGALVAATDLSCPVNPECAFQGLTLVLPDHRGHGLGRWVKVANLQQLARVRPAAQRVITWNAAENEHMLAINLALGFRLEGVNVDVQKRV